MILMILEGAASRRLTMKPRIAEMCAHLLRLEDELEIEVAKGRVLSGFSVKGMRVRFDKPTTH